MKKLAIALFTLTAAPALAHSGAHIHPHSTDPVWIVMLSGLALAAGAAVVWARRK